MTATETNLYVTDDGKTILRGSPEEVCEGLRASSWATGQTLQDWIRGTAVRVLTQTGRPVSDRTPETFVEGLCSAGLLTRVVVS